MAYSKPATPLNFPLLSVQELTKEPITSVPQQYVHSNQQTLTLSDSTASLPTIPTIDFKQLVSPKTTDLELEKLDTACKGFGLFQLVNHGISSSLVEKMEYEIGEFYELSLEEKMKFKIREGDVEGYGTVRLEEKLDWGDRFFMITNPIHKRKPHLLPELPSSLRNTLQCYLLELQKLSMKILGFMAKALEMEMKEMEETFDDGMQAVRMTYYPPCPRPELVVGIRAHSDATGITILNQVNGVDGLQIKKDGVWIPVNFIPDALVVNVGDILEILSNGAYHSVEHRAVVNSEKERISIAFFVNPKFEADVGPAISLINPPQNPPLYRRMTMEKYVEGFFSRKLNGKSYLEHMKITTEDM